MNTTRAERPSIVGPDAGPEPPFPLRLEGEVVKGFGRGSKELGIPTANIPIDGLSVGGRTDVESGIYFGYAGLRAPALIHRTSSLPAGASVVAARSAATAAATQSNNKAMGSNNDDDAEQEEEAITVTSNDDASSNGQGHHHAVVYPMVMSVGWNPFYKNEKRSVEIHIIHDFTHDFYGAHIKLSILGFVRPELDYVSKEALIEDIRTDIRVAAKSLEREAWRAFRSDGWLVGERD